MIMSDYEDYIDAIIEAGKKAGYKNWTLWKNVILSEGSKT
jgi:hypothetical protein